MSYAKCSARALVLPAAFLVATYAGAQASADNSANQNSGQQASQQANSGGQSDQNNNTSQPADQQKQNQTSSANNTSSSSGNAQQGANNTTPGTDNSKSQTNQDSSPALEPPANKQQSDRDSSTDRNTSARSGEQDQRGSASAGGRSSAEDRQDSKRDQAGSQYDNRSDNRDRSRQYDQRNLDGRSTRTDQNFSRDQRSSRRADMRAPDMGLWFNRSSRDGLVIADVAPRGAIAKFGFREGDRIVSINGRPVTSEAEFMDYVFHGNTERVNVVVFRDGREQTIVVEPTVFTEEYENPPVNPMERFGIILDDRYDDRIVVWRVIPNSPAYYAGFHPGDVIASFSGRPYRTRTDFETSVGTWNPGEANVQIRRGDRPRELSVEIPVFDRSMERSARRGERIETRQSIRNDNNQTPNNRPGILNGPGLRGRGNR